MNADAFENSPLEETSLPKVAELTFEPLEPRYRTALFIPWFVTWLILVIAGHAVFYIAADNILFIAIPWVLVPGLGLLLLVTFLVPPIVRAYGLALRTHDIHFRSGIIWRKVTSLPFNRIQHVELESGPVDRMLKLATLKIFTAGGGSTDMRIPGLGPERAGRLRATILEKAGIEETDKSDDAG